MNKLPDKIQNIQNELNELTTKKSFEQTQRVILSVVNLLIDTPNDLNNFQLFNDTDRKIYQNASWFFEDSIIADRKATYKICGDNKINIDFKLYGVNKASKRVISWATALTPNFEDELFNTKFSVGIDFIVPKSTDRVIIVLTNKYIIRTLELKGELTATYQEILGKWLDIKDFSNKTAVHNALWESFDLQPLNKKFYAGVSERFVLLRQYLVNENILDSKHASMFANRLLGRVIFCWFLDKKGIINPTLKYFDSESFELDTDYYRTKLERLFFGVLNTPIEDREYKDDVTPFLNGGLFEARENDLYKDSKLSFPKNYFDDLYSFLLAYNFTTDESTSQFQQVAIDPEMLGRIFENLLAEITEETGEQARKAKGAFYTPREIVDYMCKESLKEYLKTKLPEDSFRDQRLYQLIDAPDKDFQDQDHNWRRDWKPYKDAIIKALDELKVLDPACGSGAFPIGMLQLLVRVYERLESRFDSYRTKLQVIEKNIYGVDIEPMAVEIARLRTWLSIVVDEESDSSKIKPLPNLDFKFVCANSLIDLDQSGETAIGEDPELAKNLQEVRDSYFNTESVGKKKKLRAEYDKLIATSRGLFGESEKTKQLKTYRPFDNESSASFFNPDFMFGVTSFNIVIANPPYVGEKGHKDIFRKVVNSSIGKRFYKRKMDLFYFFFHIAFDYLKESGIASFITTNYFITATGATKLRADIRDRTAILQLINFGELKIFESALGQHNMISIFKKGFNKDTIADTIVSNQKGYLGIDTISSIINKKDSKTNYFKLKQSDLYTSNNIKLTIGGLDCVLDKIRDLGIKLDEIAEVNQGLRTGSDKVTPKHISENNLDFKKGEGIFIISENELAGLDLTTKEFDYIKPLFKNSDISKYYTNTTTKYNLIDLFFPNDKDVDLDKIPNILSHLSKYKKILENRKENANGIDKQIKKGNYYFASVRRKLDFDQEKIVAPQRSRTNTFGYNNTPWYASADVYFITQPKDKYSLKFILGVLNSHTVFLWLFNRGKRKGEMLELYQEPLSVIPIPIITDVNKNIVKEVEVCVNDILNKKKLDKNANIKEFEQKIDELVMDLYGLNDDEKEIMRNSTK